MNIELNRIRTPQPIPLAEENSAGKAEAKAPLGLEVTEASAGDASPIPGEEAVDAAVLRRDDDLGRLVDKAFGGLAAERVINDIGFMPIIDAGLQVAKNIGDSAEKLKELFKRNREVAEVKRDRMESMLAAEAAKAMINDERLDTLAREIGLRV